MFCHGCGNELPETAKFCPKCGAEVVKRQTLEKKIHSFVKNEKKEDFKKEQTGIGQVPLFKKIADIKQNGKKILAVACIALVVVVAISGNGNSNSSSSGSGSSSGSSSLFSDRSEPKKILDCLTCDGDGDCNTCGGYGRESFYAGAGDSVDAVCSTCHGSGKCRTCGGSGKR